MSSLNDFMTPRLLKIASMVDDGACIIDVGCDHGYIPIYLAGAGKIRKALAADVNTGPLCAASANIEKYGFSDKIKTVRSDGLLNLDPDGYDTIIIAGMGGVLISEILEANVRGKTYILQPMTAVDYLMGYLSDNGFKVVEHTLAREDNHIYNILKVVDGYEKIEDIHMFLGKNIARDELYYKYAEKLKAKFKKIILGLSNSKTGDPEKLDKFKKLQKSLERVVK